MVKPLETASLKRANHCPQTNGSFIDDCAGLLKSALSQFRAALPMSDAFFSRDFVFGTLLATPSISPSHPLVCCPGSRSLHQQSSSSLFITPVRWLRQAQRKVNEIRERVGLVFHLRKSNAFLSGKLFRLSPPTGAHMLVLRCVHIDPESLPQLISLTGNSAAKGSRPSEGRRSRRTPLARVAMCARLRLAPFFRE